MSGLVIASIRVYLKTLARLSPRLAENQAYRLFSTPRTRRPAPSSVTEVMADAESQLLATEGGEVMAYRWPLDGASDAPRVLLMHGWESRAARLAVWVEPLRMAGFEVVAFDAPAHGDSPGKRSGPSQFVAGITALAEKWGPFYGMVGHSLGALSTLISVAGGPVHGRANLDVEKIVILAGAESGVDAMSMFCDILGLGQDFLPRVLAGAARAAGSEVADFDAHKMLQARAVPTLWFHDPEDDDVPYECAQRVLDVGHHLTFETVHGLGHNNLARDPAIITQGVGFLTAD